MGRSILFLSAIWTVSITNARADFEPWLKGPCVPDAQKFCRSVIEEGGDILSCMRAHSAEFNPKCKLPAVKKSRATGSADESTVSPSPSLKK